MKISLFPEKLKDLETDCSCPDWSNPCKHIAAVYYLLGEEFDRDPFLIFKLRGMDRDELLGMMDISSVPDDIALDELPVSGLIRNRKPAPRFHLNHSLVTRNYSGDRSRAATQMPRRSPSQPFQGRRSRGSEVFHSGVVRRISLSSSRKSTPKRLRSGWKYSLVKNETNESLENQRAR